MGMKKGRVRTMYITWNVAGIEPFTLPWSSVCEGVYIHTGFEETGRHYLDRWQKLRPKCPDAENVA
jgi:hypothetical protein